MWGDESSELASGGAPFTLQLRLIYGKNMDLCNFTNNLQITSSLLLWQPVCGWMDDKWASPLTEPADLKQTIADRVSPEGRKIRELLSWELLRYRRGCSSLCPPPHTWYIHSSTLLMMIMMMRPLLLLRILAVQLLCRSIRRHCTCLYLSARI